MKAPAQTQKDSQLAAFAAHLRAERIRQNRSLVRTAKNLAISRAQLIALEAWDESALPTEAFRVGILNGYADLLSVAPIRLNKMPERRVVISRKARTPFIVSRWVLGMLVAVVAVSLVAYIAWISHSLVARPALKIYSPTEDSKVTSEQITVSGRADSRSIVSVDGVSVAIAEDGKFSAVVYVRPGENDIMIRTVNSLGRQTTITRHVYR